MKPIHREYHLITVVMTDGTAYQDPLQLGQGRRQIDLVSTSKCTRLESAAPSSCRSWLAAA